MQMGKIPGLQIRILKTMQMNMMPPRMLRQRIERLKCAQSH